MAGPVNKKSLLLLVFIAAAFAELHSFEISLTDKQVGAALKPEFVQSFYYCFSGELSGSVEFNNLLNLSGGLSLGQTGDIFEVDTFVSADFAFPFPWFVPLHVKAAYVFQGLPAYKNYTHVLLPTLSLQYRWAGFSLGPAFRFNQFYDDFLFEPVLAYLVYINFYNTEKIKIGFSVGNVSDFSVDNIAVYSIRIYDRVQLFDGLFIFHELGLPFSGSMARSVSAYGLVLKAGVVYKW
jgi:hypothetical protein